MEDEFLIEQTKDKPAVFADIYKKYADRIFNYFWYRTGHDKPLSEDLMQETFLRAFQQRVAYEAKGYSYLTYLLTIAHNLLVDHYRKPKSIPVEDVVLENVPYEITDELVNKSDAEALWRALQTLPQMNRDVLLMFYQQHMSVRDIAKVMSKSENGIKLILSRTGKRLADHPYLQDIGIFSDTKRAYARPKYLQEK